MEVCSITYTCVEKLINQEKNKKEKTMPQDVNTFGWDTVYAASFPVVNNAIMDQKSFPLSFDWKDSAGVTIKGSWQSWQLISGGSGGNVQMKCLVQSGAVSGLSQPDGDLKDASLIIQVKLQKVADASKSFTDPTAKPGTGNAHIITVNTSAVGEDPAVSVLQSSQYPNVTSELFKDLLGSIFGKYFNDNISNFPHVFSVMMLNVEAAKGDFAWLKPSDFSYAVGSSEDGKLSNSVFGVLCLTEGAKVSGGMQQAIDISALQSCSTCGTYYTSRKGSCSDNTCGNRDGFRRSRASSYPRSTKKRSSRC